MSHSAKELSPSLAAVSPYFLAWIQSASSPAALLPSEGLESPLLTQKYPYLQLDTEPAQRECITSPVVPWALEGQQEEGTGTAPNPGPGRSRALCVAPAFIEHQVELRNA